MKYNYYNKTSEVGIEKLLILSDLSFFSES